MVQDLLSGRPILSTARAYLEPSVFVSVIKLGRGFGADDNDIAFVGQIHAVLYLFPIKIHYAYYLSSGYQPLLKIQACQENPIFQAFRLGHGIPVVR